MEKSENSGFLAHLSQRLIGELIGYSWFGICPSVCPSSIVRPFTMLKDLLLQNRLANQSQFYVEPPWVGGTKVCSRHLGHMTKMAVMPIYGKKLKTPQKSSSPEPAGRFS